MLLLSTTTQTKSNCYFYEVRLESDLVDLDFQLNTNLFLIKIFQNIYLNSLIFEILLLRNSLGAACTWIRFANADNPGFVPGF